MNTAIIERTFKMNKGKNANGIKGRRKQSKIRYDTFRREEQPDAADLRLEDIHFANFLGLSKCKSETNKSTITYNDNQVNISYCDSYLRPLVKQVQVHQAAGQGGCVLDQTTICYCFLLGICGRSNGCKFIHVPPADIPKYKEFFMEDDGIIGSEDEGWVEEEEEEFVMEPPDSRVRLTQESISDLRPIAGLNSMVAYNTLKMELAKQIEDDKV